VRENWKASISRHLISEREYVSPELLEDQVMADPIDQVYKFLNCSGRLILLSSPAACTE